jgi:hypothetical protein
MPSERQLAANKKNAQKSTGPKTPEGRAAVRLNGVKHGLTASTLVLPGESESDFESLLDSFEAEHHPATPTEEALVRQMAMAQWRLRRLYHVEAAFLSLRLDENAEDPAEIYETLDDAGRLAYVVQHSADTLTNLSHIEARLERSFYKALQELRRLRADHSQKMQNQTQSRDRTLPPQPSPGPDHPEIPEEVNAPPPQPLPLLSARLCRAVQSSPSFSSVPLPPHNCWTNRSPKEIRNAQARRLIRISRVATAPPVRTASSAVCPSR